MSFPTDLGFPYGDFLHHCGFDCSGSGSAWVSDGGRPFVQESAVKHVPTFRLIRWRENHHSGNTAQKAKIERPLVGWAIRTDNPRPVNCKGHVQALHTDVMNQLVIGPLQEGRIDGHHGLETIAGSTGCEGQCMLFGDPDIKVSIWILFGKLYQS